MCVFEKSVRLEKARALVISMQMHNWSFKTSILWFLRLVISSYSQVFWWVRTWASRLDRLFICTKYSWTQQMVDLGHRDVNAATTPGWTPRSTLALNRAYILLIWPSWMYLLLFIILVYLDYLSKLVWYGPGSSNICERVQKTPSAIWKIAERKQPTYL